RGPRGGAARGADRLRDVERDGVPLARPAYDLRGDARVLPLRLERDAPVCDLPHDVPTRRPPRIGRGGEAHDAARFLDRDVEVERPATVQDPAAAPRGVLSAP